VTNDKEAKESLFRDGLRANVGSLLVTAHSSLDFSGDLLMLQTVSKDAARRRIHVRIRAQVTGRVQSPRLNVFRSLNHIYAQVVDDACGHTLVTASTRDKEVRKTLKGGGNIAAAKVVGQVLAQRAIAAGIPGVVFDRGGYAYHGRVKALADAARAAGLKF